MNMFKFNSHKIINYADDIDVSMKYVCLINRIIEKVINEI